MTNPFRHRLWQLALVFPVLLISFLIPTQSTQADPAKTAAVKPSPFDRPGMWIWYIDSSHGGNLNKIIRRARASKIGTLYIKSGDGSNVWSQFTSQTVRRLKRAGLSVCGWQYTYGTRPVAEARVAAEAKRRGADCFVINAEVEYKGRYAEADRYVRVLRRQVGPRYPIGLSTFPYAHYHQTFPYSVFLGPGAANVNLPQIYWHTIGDTARQAVEITWEQNRLYKRKIYPTGQTWDNPGRKAILNFRRYLLSYGTTPSWWSWQETNTREWQALRPKVKAFPRYKPFRGHPTKQSGDSGDHIVWLQQHLFAAGNRIQISGIFGQSTERAVRKFQRENELPVDGIVDTKTWNKLLRIQPVRVRWSAGGTSSRAAGISNTVGPAAPASAALPTRETEFLGPNRRFRGQG